LADDDYNLREEIIRVAQAEARRRGWSWLEPVHIAVVRVTPLGRVWEIRTNSQARGMNVRVEVNDWDLVIAQAGYLSR
jgi:hypothetical protein